MSEEEKDQHAIDMEGFHKVDVAPPKQCAPKVIVKWEGRELTQEEFLRMWELKSFL